MKKGFTLIELLAVIAILAVILLIAVPQILDVVNSVRDKAYIQNENLLSTAAETYLSKNIELLPSSDGDIAIIKMTSLKNADYISDIVSNDDNSQCDGYVLVKKEGNNLTYNPYIDCGSDYKTANYNDEYGSNPVTIELDILVVAGGGAGGSHFENISTGTASGGGGAGGVVFEAAETYLVGTDVDVVVGEGGISLPLNYGTGGNGENSSFGGHIAIGGGGGASKVTSPNSGGSGGGVGYTVTTGASGTISQGNAGGSSDANMYGGTGGGGAGSAGTYSSGNNGTAGGNGLYFGDKFSDIYGASGWFAGGGGGGGRDGYLGGTSSSGGGAGASNASGIDGTINTGGGGGGSGDAGHKGGNGGSGIVIVRYAGSQKANGGIVTEYNGYTIHAFLSGTDTFEVLDY